MSCARICASGRHLRAQEELLQYIPPYREGHAQHGVANFDTLIRSDRRAVLAFLSECLADNIIEIELDSELIAFAQLLL